MKIGINLNNGLPSFYIKYEKGEWENIERILLKMGLEKAESIRIFGEQQGKFYRDTSEQLGDIVRRSLSKEGSIHDVNKPFLNSYGNINTAIFRVVPVQGTVLAPIPKFLSVSELNTIASSIREVYQFLINLAIEDEVEIKNESLNEAK